MLENNAFPRRMGRILGATLPLLVLVPTAHGFSAKPDDSQGAKVVGHLMATNFTKQCDVNTYPLRKNLSFLFDNKYIGLEFKSWKVDAAGNGRYDVILHYIDGEAGPTSANWTVNLDAQKASFDGENAEVLSCMTGYL